MNKRQKSITIVYKKNGETDFKFENITIQNLELAVFELIHRFVTISVENTKEEFKSKREAYLVLGQDFLSYLYSTMIQSQFKKANKYAIKFIKNRKVK